MTLFGIALAVSACSSAVGMIAVDSSLVDDLSALAAPINTGLLIVLWWLQTKRSRSMAERVKDVHTDVQHAAGAASSAAECAAVAARIAQELGGQARRVDLPPTLPDGQDERREGADA
jgi:hypothetical protein